MTGEFLPDGSPPPSWNDPAPNNFAPYVSREAYELADLLFRRNQMPEDQINDLMQIWARTLPVDEDPPFANAPHLYATIDATVLGHIPWELVSAEFQTDNLDEEDINTPWKMKSYDIWFRGPLKIIKVQLGRRDFVGEIDFALKQVRDGETNVRRYQDFMSGEWAWDQVVSGIYQYCLNSLYSKPSRISLRMTWRITVQHSALLSWAAIRQPCRSLQGKTSTIPCTFQMG